MFKYVLKRIAFAVLVMFTVATITFFLSHAIPGGPFDSDKKVPETVLKNLEATYNLDKPVYVQYTLYMQNLLKGDLGPSFRYPTETINEIIVRAFPVSATIGIFALLLSIVVGIPAGIVSAIKRNSIIDNILLVMTTILISIPSFVLATLLMYFLAFKFRLLPAALWGTPKQAVMPIIALAGYPIAYITKLMRSSTLEVLSQDYIRTAKAKGMPEVVVIYVHALKNAVLPVITILGPIIAWILVGGFVVEKIFAIPGLGTQLITGILNRDYTMIMGITIFYSFLLVTFLLLVDIAYVLVDPRIKLGGGTKN